MSQLTVLLDDAEKLMIANELSRLFALQDMALSKEKKGYFLEELYLSGLPVGAILAGLRSLVAEDLRSIKISTVTAASREHLSVEDRETAKTCVNCFDGWVSMKDDEGRSFTLACTCARGKQRKGKLATWNGEDNFYIQGRWLKIIYPVAKEKSDEKAAEEVPF